MRAFILLSLGPMALCSALLSAKSAEMAAERESLRLMADAARTFLASLTNEQRQKVMFGINDEERANFRTTPMPVGGLTIGEMRPDQVVLMHTMLNAGLSARGYAKAASIMALEAYLVELEQARGRANRFHGLPNYRIAIFGEPAVDGTWGWRIHGHHLCLYFTVVKGEFFASAPAFLGAEPHYVADGPRKGWHVLGAEENLGRALMESLSPEERAKATIATEMPADMFTGSNRKVEFEQPPKGIAYADLGPEKQGKLRALVMEYVLNVPADLVQTRLEKIERGGWDKIHFAWIGSLERGERNYYRVQGPEFLIEYCAVALTPNHVHTVWREYDGDFGRDILAEHYQAFPH